MRLLFDALSSTEYSGGMRVHALETIRSWVQAFPEDEIYVVGPKSARDEYTFLHVSYIALESEKIITRAPAQLLIVPILTLKLHPDFVISMSPMISMLIPKKRSVVYEHDWRHVTHPDEFPLWQRLYRKLWIFSARHACLCVCISDKTRKETQARIPKAHAVTIENGRDHARYWNVSDVQRTSNIVTFGQHNNKRADLVIKAFSLLAQNIGSDVRLVILGARGEYAEVLRKVARDANVYRLVVFPGFVSSEEAHETIASARVIVLASSDEGFGLPVAESQYFGIPCVVTSDSGIADIYGDFPLVCQPNEISLAKGISQALSMPVSKTDSLWTWGDTVKTIRAELIDMVGK